MRIKVQTLRMLLWLGNLVVLAGIGLLLLKIIMGNRGNKQLFPYMNKSKIEAKLDMPASIAEGSGGGRTSWTEFDSLHRLNVTGKEKPKPVETRVEEGPRVVPLKPIEEVLKVETFMYCLGDPTASMARLRYHDSAAASNDSRAYDPTKERSPSRLQPDFVRIGDGLRDPWSEAPHNGKVLDITQEGVLFTWGDGEVMVGPPTLPTTQAGNMREMPGMNDKIDPEELAAMAAAARESKQVSKDSWFIGTDERDKIKESYDEILSEVTIGTHFLESDKRLRIKMAKVPEDSLAYERGFREGDVVRRINGEEISSRAAAIQYFKKHPNTNLFTIELVRQGAPLTKVFTIAR